MCKLKEAEEAVEQKLAAIKTMEAEIAEKGIVNAESIDEHSQALATMRGQHKKMAADLEVSTEEMEPSGPN